MLNIHNFRLIGLIFKDITLNNICLFKVISLFLYKIIQVIPLWKINYESYLLINWTESFQA